MQLGATFPQTEISPDPGAIRAFAQAVEDLGYDYILVYDHVLGADVSVRPDWRPDWGGPPAPPAYTHKDPFHEPFVLFGYLAAVTKRVGIATGVLVVSQRQTALVAKQAAEVDVLSGGRLRLGVGTGWNDVEYEALGMSFHDRGVRSEEQIALLRALWTKDVVTFKGKWHAVTAAGINPLPVQRPIPIWIGGRADAVLRRVARLGDGWCCNLAPTDAAQEAFNRLRAYAKEEGRDPSTMGIETAIVLRGKSPEERVESAKKWESMGATHVAFNTMRGGFATVDAHVDALRRFKTALAG